VVGERLCKHKYSAYCVDDIEDVAKDDTKNNDVKNDAADTNGVHPSTVIAVTSPLLSNDAKSDNVDTDVDAGADAKPNLNGKETLIASQEKLPSISFSKPEQVKQPSVPRIFSNYFQGCKAYTHREPG
jgi:hypothetical protein